MDENRENAEKYPLFYVNDMGVPLIMPMASHSCLHSLCHSIIIVLLIRINEPKLTGSY